MLENYHFRRLAAKFIDVFIIFVFVQFLRIYLSFFAVLLGMMLLPLADYLGEGLGVAKRFMGIRVIPLSDLGKNTADLLVSRVNFSQCLLRNLPIMILLGVGSVPILGTLLWFLLGIPYCVFEIYLMFSVKSHQRLGDVLARTVVVDLTGHTDVDQ